MDVLAALTVETESGSVRATVNDLDALTASSVKAEGATQGVGTSMQKVDAHALNMSRALDSATKHTKAMQQAGLNMGRQMTDVFVQLGSGGSLFLVALQQGPQVFDGLQVAAMQTGRTVTGVMLAMGASIWTAMAPLIPLMAGIAVAAAAIAAPFAISAAKINRDNAGMLSNFGLTKAQLESVGGAGVTMGDVLTGVWKSTSKALTEAFGPEIEAVKGFFSDMFGKVIDFSARAVRNIAGGFIGALLVIKDTWRLLPAAIGDLVISAANMALRGVFGMVNGAVDLINNLVSKANDVAEAVGLAFRIPELNNAQVVQLTNQYAGAAYRLGQASGERFAEGFAIADRMGGGINGETLAARERRLRRGASTGTDANAAAVAANAERAAAAVAQIEEIAPQIAVALEPIGVPLIEMATDLDKLVWKLEEIVELTAGLGDSLSRSFGRVGGAIGDATSMLAQYALARANIQQNAVAMNEDEAKTIAKNRKLEIDSFAEIAGVAKNAFGERTAAYKILATVEAAYRALQFANTVRAMALDTAETGSSIGNALARGAAYAAEAVAKIFAKLGPWGFPVAAAALGMMAAIGIRAAGGASSSAPTLPTMNEGTGTVLGDPGAESASITKSLELAEKYYRQDLVQGVQMVTALKAIQSSIGAVANSIARQMGLGGALDTTGLNQGPVTSGGFLGMFTTTRSSEVIGQGLNLTGGQLADLITNGVRGSFFQLIEMTKTKSGFLGFGGGTTTWTTETTTPIDDQISMELARVLGSLRAGVLSAAGQLGIEGAQATLDALTISLGRIDFTGLSSSEITERLNAVFSAAGDQMAAAILPQLAQYQRAGEGMMETLVRLATMFQAVDTALVSIGMQFNAVGLESLAARDRLVELVGGLDALTEQTNFFASEFLTEAQRLAPVQAAVSAELERLGLATNISRTQFADLVRGLDVSTEAGAAMFASLMRLAPALDMVLDYQEELTGSITNAADLDRQRRELEIRLMEAQGRIAESLAARRADELAAMDAALRPMQQAVWAAQDMAQAAAELAAAEQLAADAQRALASQRRDLEIQLMEAQGNAAGALAARRELELAALDATLRPLQMAIYAALDLAAASDVLAQAQADAAAAAEEAARAAEALASQRRTLEIDLMEATGDAAGALAARRELELAALDASLRPLQLAIFAALDLAAANETLANAQAEAAAQAEAEAQRVAQLAASRRDLEIQLLDAQGRGAEAVAARRALEIEALDASLRPLQLAIFAALDLASAAETLAQAQAEAAAAAEAEAQRVAQIATARRDLEIQLLEAQGNAVDALAARRQIELSALDESLRPLQESIWATLDLAAARATETQAAADAAEAARALASQRRDLDIQLLEATGDATGALAARRMDELAALDASLRPIQEAIWAALDLADANQRLADVQAEAAAAAEREAERLADIARQQRDLDIQLMDAVGNASGALTARRADELAAMDESLRATQRAIWAAIDLAQANDVAAQAQQEAADAALRIADQRRNLEIQLLEATGNAAAALAARRQDELAALDASLRPIQMQIYAAQDLAEAQARAAEAQAESARAAEEAAAAYERLQDDARARVEDARSNLTQAYQREADALRGTIDRFRDFGDSIREFRANLDASGPGSSSYAQTRAVFEQTAALAKLGNQDALGSLTGASQSFLDAALNNASSALAYNRDVSAVKAALDAAAGTADRTVSVAEQQLAQLDASVSGLITINESVLSVRDGILALQAAMLDARRLGVTQFASGGVFTSPTMFQMGGSLGQMAEAGPEAILPLVDGPNGLGVRSQTDGALLSELRSLRAEVANLRAEQKAGHTAIATNTGQMAREAKRWTDDGLYVRGEDPDQPLEVSVAA